MIFVESIDKEITYTYERSSSSGAAQKEHFEIPLTIPDFQESLLKIYRASFLPQKKPIYLHVARI